MESEISGYHVASMKMTVFWNVALYSLVETDGRFRSAYCLHHQGDRLLKRRSTYMILFYPWRYSSEEPWPAEQPPLAVFPDCTRRTGLTCGQHIESHSCIFSFPNRTVTSLWRGYIALTYLRPRQ
jgi:hypothetical protein